MEDVIRHIAERDGWGGSDEEILSAATEEDFYKIFKMKEGKDLSAYVDVCLQFGRFVDATEQQKAIAEKAKNALMKIGQESNLNRIRVRKYGISIDNNS